MFTARLGDSQSRLPLMPKPTTSETKATNMTPLRPTFPRQMFFKFIQRSYFFFTASTSFFTRIQVAAGLFLQHAENIDHLFGDWNIGFTFSAQGVRYFTQVHERLGTETNDKSRKVDFRKGFMTRLGFAL